MIHSKFKSPSLHYELLFSILLVKSNDEESLMCLSKPSIIGIIVISALFPKTQSCTEKLTFCGQHSIIYRKYRSTRWCRPASTLNTTFIELLTDEGTRTWKFVVYGMLCRGANTPEKLWH